MLIPPQQIVYGSTTSIPQAKYNDGKFLGAASLYAFMAFRCCNKTINNKA